MAIKYKYGIDFGTTNSSISLYYDADGNKINRSRVFNVDTQNIVSRKLLPSIVYLDMNDSEFVGTKAKYEYTKNDDIPPRFKSLIKKIKLLLDKEKKDVVVTTIGRKKYYISDIIALLLKELEKKANKDHIENISGYVFGVPVNYNDDCKRIMIESTVKAGFFKSYSKAEANVEFFSEPVAVALDYGININSNKKVLVFDFGGGTLDLALVQLIKDNDDGKHEVIAKERITIGGEKYTEQFFKKAFISKYGLRKTLKQFGFDNALNSDQLWERLNNDPLGIKLIDNLDRIKCILSEEEEEDLYFQEQDIYGGNTRKINIQCSLNREDFENAINDSLADIEDVIYKCLGSVNINKSEIDDVLMAGGSSLIPCIKELLISIFGNRKVHCSEERALTSIVEGLAIKGYQVDDIELIDDIVDSNYGVWFLKEKRIETIVEKNTKIEETKIDLDDIDEGKYIDCRSIDSGIPRIEVYQDFDKIGEFTLPDKGSGHYRIYFEIDKDHGWLTVQVFDRKTMLWYNNRLENNVFNLN